MITTTAIIAPVIMVIISLDFCFKIVYDIANLILSHSYCIAFMEFSTIASRILALSYDTPNFSIFLFFFLKKTPYVVHLSFGWEEKKKRKGEKKEKKYKNLQRKNKN